ncbi:MAG: hypothetical protein GY928_16620 [Colwellia sp.]|nr:hypothetical protein [Colwellia sp.]
MKLIKGNGQQRYKCKHCKGLIDSIDWRFKAREGDYCFNDGRIKRLHDGVMIWINKIISK